MSLIFYNLSEANEGFFVVVELFQSDRYYIVMTLIYGIDRRAMNSRDNLTKTIFHRRRYD